MVEQPIKGNENFKKLVDVINEVLEGGGTGPIYGQDFEIKQGFAQDYHKSILAKIEERGISGVTPFIFHHALTVAFPNFGETRLDDIFSYAGSESFNEELKGITKRLNEREGLEQRVEEPEPLEELTEEIKAEPKVENAAYETKEANKVVQALYRYYRGNESGRAREITENTNSVLKQYDEFAKHRDMLARRKVAPDVFKRLYGDQMLECESRAKSLTKLWSAERSQNEELLNLNSDPNKRPTLEESFRDSQLVDTYIKNLINEIEELKARIGLRGKMVASDGANVVSLEAYRKI